ncbi:ATP-binding protein [Streptomyces jumonjinensis]|uniref:ATP-binding protein n=1 Tax=Streptomyces jumonjinensis TaxID=1945 RepID=A0A646KEG4_STRJU|nr:ATP-binding protein [Streptomyces jumonjinensis]MQT00471.1 ATP-binding protein [Streptomyces jumonjinensis]
MPTYRRTFSGCLEEIRTVRGWTRDVLGGSSRVDDAALIVSELSANAVVHTASGVGTGTFEVCLTPTGRHILISVADIGGTARAPRLQHPGEEDTRGRGLGMVSALADRVEIRGGVDGHTVTVSLTHVPGPSETALRAP